MGHRWGSGAGVGVVEKHLLMGCERYFRALNRDGGCLCSDTAAVSAGEP